jgi:hypothetical protein
MLSFQNLDRQLQQKDAGHSLRLKKIKLFVVHEVWVGKGVLHTKVIS